MNKWCLIKLVSIIPLYVNSMCMKPHEKTYIVLQMCMSLETFASSLHMYTL